MSPEVIDLKARLGRVNRDYLDATRSKKDAVVVARLAELREQQLQLMTKIFHLEREEFESRRRNKPLGDSLSA
jgi:hypothetical protein